METEASRRTTNTATIMLTVEILTLLPNKFLDKRLIV